MKWILFDLDGTLLDTSALIEASLRYVLLTQGFDTEEIRHLTWGRPLREVLRELCPGRERAALETYQEFYRQNRHMVEIFPGIRATLDRLARAGYPMAIVTNKSSEPAREDLRSHQLTEFFSAFVGRGEVLHPKPHPEPVLQALEALSACPLETLMVGDTRWDMIAGRSAGVRTGAALWGPDPESIHSWGCADYSFHKPAEILHLFPGASGHT